VAKGFSASSSWTMRRGYSAGSSDSEIGVKFSPSPKRRSKVRPKAKARVKKSV
jgi:hypothetical protein